MLLMSHDRLHAAHVARAAAELDNSDHFVLPSIVSPSPAGRSRPAHRRANNSFSSTYHGASLSPTRVGGRTSTVGASPIRGSLVGAMTLTEIAKVGPSTLDAHKFCDVSAPCKGVSMGQPQGQDQEAIIQQELEQAAVPGPQEKHMSERQQELAANVRTEVLMFKPNKVLQLHHLHDLLELLVLDVLKHESTIDTLKTQMRENADKAGIAQQHAAEELHKKEELIAAKDRELMQAELKRHELEETTKHLEEQLNTAAGIGMTAQEAARTMTQLTKAKASIEAMKKQISALEDKVVNMEKQKRQEEMALKEKKAAIERQLKETLEKYGPERCRELTEQLHEATNELKVTNENLNKSKIAQKQQHKLVVSWRITVDEINDKMSVQSQEMDGLNKDIADKARLIADLEAQLWQAEQDLKKQSMQLTQLNEKMNEYVEKYTRQAAYISQMESQWKAAEAERLLAQEGEDSDEG
jgi:chromosome segregation ATPase